MAQGVTTVVIVGASGDLARRKLLPALFSLWCKGRLPEGLRVVGLARSPFTEDQFCDLMWEGAREFGELADQHDEWDTFATNLFYVNGDLSRAEDFSRLRQRLEALE
ncbi:MAG: glucose-6-phosphate dehydrogenase, partial [Chloroflexi bacterium]|nr:glucose-6-phosphate dehydrogenase [Chloroflexota bacterium]